MIVATAVDETRRAAEEACLVRQREWEVDSWRETKKVMTAFLFCFRNYLLPGKTERRQSLDLLLLISWTAAGEADSWSKTDNVPIDCLSALLLMDCC